ncbi:MAG: phosphoribosylamine--glycine ligase [bacterium]
MKLLIVGSGGREHTLAWRLGRDDSVDEIIAAPGNAGIGRLARCVDVAADDVEGLTGLAVREGVELVVVGPELPLTLGLADRLREEGIACFGPGAAGARLEGSKAWSKDLMERAGIPTAGYEVFTELDPALAYLDSGTGPIVVKASGLAAGKGAIVCEDRDGARRAVREMLEEDRFGEAGHTVVIEDFLTGEEASILALTDGMCMLPLVPSQDHKRAHDGDQGPNTGGMGAYAPAPVVSEEVMRKVRARILEPLLKTLAEEGVSYHGVVYAGLMIDDEGDPGVVEFNCRFGDPEAQVVLPLVEGDLAEALLAAAQGRLDPDSLAMGMGAAVCVVMASGGYPGGYEKGYPIEGLEELEGEEDVVVFHAGTAQGEEGVVTAGGRVLGVTAMAPSIPEAVRRSYQAVERVRFQDAFYRSDIAHRALAREE